MDEKYLITIVGTSTVDGDVDMMEFKTRGDYKAIAGGYDIIYKEGEMAGFKDCNTTVTVLADKVTMTRKGSDSNEESVMVVEPDKRHISHYETEHGAITMGLSAGEITSKLGEDGGTVEYSYNIDANTQLLSQNKVKITVREVK